MLVDKSGDEKSDDEQIGVKEDNKDVRITNENDVTEKIKNKPSSRNPLKEEKFYYIGNEFEKKLNKSIDSFSLLKTFDATKSDVPNREICQKQSSLKPSNEPEKKYEEKSSPEKNQLKENKDVPECSELPGLWFKEPLFFKPDDPRFEGAMKFVKYINPDYAKTFSNLRKQIKCVVRYKVQKVKQHANQRPGPKVDRHNKRKKFKANKKK